MVWGKLLGTAAVVLTVFMTIGSVAYAGLSITDVDYAVQMAVGIAFIAAVVAVGSVLGSRSREWLSNPYW